jgi:hypothetical protein
LDIEGLVDPIPEKVFTLLNDLEDVIVEDKKNYFIQNKDSLYKICDLFFSLKQEDKGRDIVTFFINVQLSKIISES